MSTFVKNGLTRKKQDTLWDIALVAPQYLLFFTFTIMPFIISLPIVFQDKLDVLDLNPDWVGIRNFISVFTAPLAGEVLPALSKTFQFFMGNYLMVFVLGVPLALFMFEYENASARMRSFFYTVIFLPWMLAPLAVGLLMLMLFSVDTGSINLVLLEWGVIKNPINIKSADSVRFFLPLMIGWRAAGFNMAIFLSGLLTIPKDTLEAADLDGCTYFQKFRCVYIPQMIPSVVMATVFCLMGSFAIFDACVGLGALRGNNSVRLLSIIIYKLGVGGVKLENRLGTLSQGIAVQLIVFIPLMIGCVFLMRYQRKKQYL